MLGRRILKFRDALRAFYKTAKSLLVPRLLNIQDRRIYDEPIPVRISRRAGQMARLINLPISIKETIRTNLAINLAIIVTQ